LKSQRVKHLYFLAFSVAIGMLSATGALLFRWLIMLFQDIIWAPGPTFLHQVLQSPHWQRLLVPTAGGLLAGIAIFRWVPEARGPGVAEVIVAVTRRDSVIRHRVTFLKALITSLLIGSGASVGREGPIAQIGASVGSSMGQLLRLDPDMRRVCLASGAAAGIAATFNAPITGTLFALEIILLDIEVAYISHIVVSAVTGSVLSRIFIGEFPTFQSAPFQMAHYWELLAYLGLGLLAGVMAIAFMRLIALTEGCLQRLALPVWSRPAAGGLLLGGIALFFPQVMGVGYDIVNEALAGSLGLKLAVVLLAAKMAATAFCTGSGMSGGIFAPSLVLGATLGTACALGADLIWPSLGLNPTSYALAGMGAMVAGTTLAPITAILTIFELTYSYETILPLMVACIASATVVRMLFGYSVYEMSLLGKGVNIVRGHDVGILRGLRVRDFMEREFESVLNTTPLMAVVTCITQSPYPHFVVLDPQGEMVGVLSLRDLQGAMERLEALEGLVIAADLMTAEVLTLTTDDNLEKALYIFEKHRISFIPVTEPLNPRLVRGILKKDDLLQAYTQKVLKDRLLSSPVR
jgi:CIC family chloride channel protein